MGRIGSFGDLVFKTSDKKVLTLSNLKQDVSGQWSSHKVIGGKPKKEFGGADIRKLRFAITLDVTLGVKPRKQLEKIEKMIETGYVDYMVIGNKAIGANKFAITSMSETWDVIYSGGHLARATLDITMEEYVEDN